MCQARGSAMLQGSAAQLPAGEGAGLWVCTASQESAGQRACRQAQPQARPTDPSPGSIFPGPDSLPTALPWSSSSTLRLAAERVSNPDKIWRERLEFQSWNLPVSLSWHLHLASKRGRGRSVSDLGSQTAITFL